MIDFIFYSFALFTVMASAMVVTLKNPVHAVLFLIFAFFNAAGLFILLGAEFIAMTLIIVYVGAVAVLFLFVVMMLNIDIAEVRQGFLKHLPLGLGLGFLIFVQIYYALTISQDSFPVIASSSSAATPGITNTEALGMLIYTNYFFVFQGAGFILLIAMIGAIVLTLTHSKDVRRQNINRQVSRTREQSVMLVDVKTGEGVSI